jgi:hypothetical protein
MGRFQLHHRRYRSHRLLRRALLTASGEAAIGARRFNGLKLSAGSARKMMLLQQTLVFADPKEREQYAALQAALNGAYGKAKYCPKNADGSRHLHGAGRNGKSAGQQPR